MTRGQESQGAEARRDMNRNIRDQGGTGDQGAEVRAAEGAGGQQTRQQTRNLPDDFGDLEQYVELSHIGSGEPNIILLIVFLK